MADFWEYIRGLFSAGEKSSPSQPAVAGLIERSEEERADFARWKETLVSKRMLNWLADQYAIYRVLPHDIDEALDFLDTPSSKGFVIHFHKTQYSRRECAHLLDLLKERVRAVNYMPQLSDTRTFSRGEWVETVERHYLKPRPKFEGEAPFSQGFGNVLIELVLRNDAPYHLKFSATAYNDRLYKEADDFQELMQVIL